MPALEARDWLTQIDGIGKKTASVLLLFSFGLPLLPIDRHVDRVLRRVGMLPPKVSTEDAHDLVLGMFAPDQRYEAHVNLIQHGRKVCHAQRPDHEACPLLRRCRFVDPKAPEPTPSAGLRKGEDRAPGTPASRALGVGRAAKYARRYLPCG